MPIKPSDEINLLNVFLGRVGCFLNDDSGSKLAKVLQSNDLIEVFDNRKVQIYRNWSFFALCSYRLIDIVNYSEDELYLSDLWAAEEFNDMHVRIFERGIGAPIVPLPLVYKRTEIWSGKEFESFRTRKLYAPIFSVNGCVAKGMLVVTRQEAMTGKSSAPEVSSTIPNILKNLGYGIAGNALYDFIKHLLSRDERNDGQKVA